MEFIRVPLGKFLMGSTEENKLAERDERPQHTVDIPYSYWMARFPVTRKLFGAFVKANGINSLDDWKKKRNHPVLYVKWNDAIGYCQWLNILLKAKYPLLCFAPSHRSNGKSCAWYGWTRISMG